MADFSTSLRREIQRTGSDVDRIIRTVLFKLGERIVERSPVGNPDLWKSKAPPGYVGGHFRAQWQHGFRSAPTEDVPDGSESVTTENMKNSIDTSPVAGIHWIVNMAPYAQKLEDGHSTQAPSGIVRLSILDFSGLLESASSSR